MTDDIGPMDEDLDLTDGTVLSRVDVGGEVLLLACVYETCPVVLSSEFPDWLTHVLGLERLFSLGSPSDPTWIIGGSVFGGAPEATNRIQVLDGEKNVLADHEVAHAWLIPMPADLNWESFFLRYMTGETVLWTDGPEGHLGPHWAETEERGKYPDGSDGRRGYAPLTLAPGEKPPEWPELPNIDLPGPWGTMGLEI